MYEYFPLLFVGGIAGLFSIIFGIAYFSIKNKKEEIGFERNMKDTEIMKRLLRYAKPHIGKFIVVGLLMAFSIAYSVISPRLMGFIIKFLDTDFEINTLVMYITIYAVILVTSLVFQYIQAIILQKIGQKILSALREDVFTHIESLSHAQLNHMPVGKLVTRVTNDTNAISMMFTQILTNLIKNIFLVVAIVVAMLMLNYALTLMVLCFVPFIFVFTLIFRKFSRRAFRRVKDGTTDINTFLSENLSGIKIIQIFNQEQRKKKEFAQKNNKLGKAMREQIYVFSVFRPIIYMLYISSVLCLFYFAGKGYIDNVSFLGQVITADVVVSFYMYIQTFFDPIQNLADQFNRLQSAFASAEKIFAIMDMTPNVVDTEGAIELEAVEGNIEFKNVWFAYEGEEWVLKDVSFKIKAKDTVAFVGSTGSGKTTILSLIC